MSGFTSLAEGRFGAGWVWLVVDTSTEDNTLKVMVMEFEILFKWLLLDSIDPESGHSTDGLS